VSIMQDWPSRITFMSLDFDRIISTLMMQLERSIKY